MSKTVQWKRGNANVNSSYTGPAGEITVNTTDWSLRVHDGATVGGWVIDSNNSGNQTGNLLIVDQTITGTVANANIFLAANGTGRIYANNIIRSTGLRIGPNTNVDVTSFRIQSDTLDTRITTADQAPYNGNIQITANASYPGIFISRSSGKIGFNTTPSANVNAGYDFVMNGSVDAGVYYADPNNAGYSFAMPGGDTGLKHDINDQGLSELVLQHENRYVAKFVDNGSMYFDGDLTVSTGNNEPYGATFPDAPIKMFANVDSYAQVVLQNISANNNASSDFVATADNGTDEQYFIDVGIASSTYEYPGFGVIKPNDAYILAVGANIAGPGSSSRANLILGSTTGNIKMFVGAPEDANVIAQITTAGFIPGANVTYNLGSSTRQWKDLWLSNSTMYLGGIPITVTANGQLAVNGSVISGGTGNYSNVNVAAYLASNSAVPIVTTSNVTGGNIIARGQIMSTSYSGGNISWTAANQTDFQGAIKVGQNIIKSAGGASSITLNNNGANIPILGVTQTIASTSTGTGALIVSGGAGIAGNVYAGGNVYATNVIGNGVTAAAANAVVSLNAFDTDDNTVSIRAQGNTAAAVIESYSSAGNNRWTWSFDNTGTLTFPDSPTSIFGGMDNDLTINTTNTNVGTVYTFTFTQFGTLNVPVNLDVAGNIYTNDIVGTGFGNVAITANTQSWLFDDDGTITLPSASQIRSVGNTGVRLSAGASDTTGLLLNNTGDAELYANANISIYADAGNIGWTFDNTGSLTVPGRITNDDGASIEFNTNNIRLNTVGGGAYIDIQDTSLFLLGNGSVVLGSSPLDWQFNGNGNLTLPANNSAILYPNGTSIIAGFTTPTQIVNGNSSVAVDSAGGNISFTVSGFNYGHIQYGGGVAIGATAGNLNQGLSSVAIGSGAATENQGYHSVAVGWNVGQYNQGTSSIAIGENPAFAAQGNSAIAIGSVAARSGQGDYAIAMGTAAGYSGQTANAIAIGTRTGQYTQGEYGIAMGYFAANSGQSANAVAIGTFAGRSSQGLNTVAIGLLAGNNSQGGSAVAVGAGAGANTQGINSVAVGVSAADLTQGNAATALGAFAGQYNQGNFAVAVGSGAAYNGQGDGAIAIGADTSPINQGDYSIAIGAVASTNAFQPANSIIIDATASQLAATGAGLFVAPVRNDVGNIGQVVTYNTSTKEFTYANTINLAGNITAGNISANVNGFAIGYRDIPQIAFTSNVTLALTDAGKHYYSANSANVITIPNNSTVSFNIGTAISIVQQGSANLTVTPGSGVTLYLAGNSTAGSRTLGNYGMATLMKVASDTWFINGTSVT